MEDVTHHEKSHVQKWDDEWLLIPKVITKPWP